MTPLAGGTMTPEKSGTQGCVPKMLLTQRSTYHQFGLSSRSVFQQYPIVSRADLDVAAVVFFEQAAKTLDPNIKERQKQFLLCREVVPNSTLGDACLFSDGLLRCCC